MEAAFKLRLLDRRTCELLHNARLLKHTESFLCSKYVNSHVIPQDQIYYYPPFVDENI